MDFKVMNQIERIKKKLILAKEADPEFKVFGASSHKYEIGPPVTVDEILKFEKEYDLELPECYKTFLLHIGNGGVSYQNSAAGPSYGIYPLGVGLDELIYENTGDYLKENCKIYPEMTIEFWDDLTQNIENESNISEEEYDVELGKIYSGILPIGSLGCTGYQTILLNGEFKGRIVYANSEGYMPVFTIESNFLDWYEKWLDEIIPESIISKDPDLFNYTLAGNTEYILNEYFSVSEIRTKIECLRSLLKKDALDSKTLDVLEKDYIKSSEMEKDLILQIFTKFDYNRAFNYLIEISKDNLLKVFQFVFWYAKDKSTDWLEVIEKNASRINDPNTFSFCTYLLKEMNIDYASIIIPFTSHPDESIRMNAYYSLGLLKNKKDYLETFIIGLNDKVNKVIHITLQALDGINDKRLLKYYKKIAEQFPVEQDYILINLNHRLKEFGLTNEKIKNIDPENY